MGTKIDVPVLMRDDSSEVVKVANAVYDVDRGSFRFRLDIDTLGREHKLFGKAIEMGLVEALQIRIVASDLGFEAVSDMDELTEQAETFDIENPT